MTLHPRLHLLPGGQSYRADALDGERSDRIRESRRRFEIVAVRESEREAGAEGVPGAGLIYHLV
ncbi:MAG TPA: hypothetical protein VKE23_12515, partial [Candidatus Limnocylindria bacterium]|nr:hypothetical protein [Candidatus Limnocylindria bacterium]